MFSFQDYAAPATVEEALALLDKSRKNRILGGTAWLRMSNLKLHTGIDLKNLGLNSIYEQDGALHIGACCTLRQAETDPLLCSYCGGLVADGIFNIVGVQFRAVAQVGASVFARYGFSDLLPSLLACGASVRLAKAGMIPLEDFLNRPFFRDILLEILLPTQNGIGRAACLRNSAGDFALLNGAAYLDHTACRIAVGARPQCAALARNAGKFVLQNRGSLPADVLAERAVLLASEELKFGSNMRGSEDYRRKMCNVLVRRMLRPLLGKEEGH